MPEAALRLVGGVDTESTSVLNENSGITSSQLIRFMYSPQGVSSVQKLGGWSQWINYSFSATIRALWAWEDLNINQNLAVGTQTMAGGISAQLAVVKNGGSVSVITPTSLTEDIAPVVTSTNGSPSILITDTTTTGITPYNSVYIATQIAIGGVVLFGLYACDPDGYLSDSAYTVYSRDILGNFKPATSTSSSPVVPQFTTTLGTLTINVNLPDYTYAVGNTFPVLVPTVCGGITIYGNYVVQTIVDLNNFTILAPMAATSAQSVYMNGGNARFIYSFGQGAIPAGVGYGRGPYGLGAYGVGVPVTPSVGPSIDANDWTLDNFGEVLIACPDRSAPANGTPFQPIYAWLPGSSSATIITNAPPINDGIFVAMPQRQIIAWGSTETGIQDPLLINWCDVNNYNQWIATVTNQAGSYRIPKGSRIVAGVQGPQQGIIWTDIDVWSMQYTGAPYVYGFTELATGCGLIGRKAAASVNGVYYWMGPSQFYLLSSGGVQPIPCSVWDAVFQNLDTSIDPVSGVSRTSKIRVAVNSRFGEIQWFYPSILGGTGEVDSYVKYNIYLGIWDYGSLGRSAWIDQSILGPPIGADPVTNYLYQHETSNDAAGQPMLSSFQTGYFSLSEGEFQTFVDWIFPDMKWGFYDAAQTATVAITFYVKNYPADVPRVYGPYSVTQMTKFFYTRLRGRLVSIKISSSDLGSFWRIGLIRYRFSQDGRI